MKAKYVVLFLLTGLLGLGSSGCAVQVQHSQKPVKTGAPGQVKKITGSQSAAPYAPGHRK